MNDRPDAPDRRTFWRSSVQAGAPLRAHVARLGGPESSCKVINISAGGMMIRTRPTLNEGDCVWVRLVGMEHPWTVLGEVRRARARGDESLVAIVFDTPLVKRAEITGALRYQAAGGRSREPM